MGPPPHEGRTEDPITHQGIGHYWCYECGEWVRGPLRGPYIDIISIDRARGTAYLACQSGVPRDDYPAAQTWETNIEVPLSDVEGERGYLPDGPQTPWVRMLWRKREA